MWWSIIWMSRSGIRADGIEISTTAWQNYITDNAQYIHYSWSNILSRELHTAGGKPYAIWLQQPVTTQDSQKFPRVLSLFGVVVEELGIPEIPRFSQLVFQTAVQSWEGLRIPRNSQGFPGCLSITLDFPAGKSWESLQFRNSPFGLKHFSSSAPIIYPL